MKYLSLFSGIGGFELGIQQAYEKATNYGMGRNGQEVHPISGRQKTLYGSRMGDKQDERLHNVTYESTPTCIGYSEIDKYAIQIYQKHFPEHKNWGSVRDIDAEQLPDFDLLVGGFPCQAFSIAGKRKGFEDARGTLFCDIARIARVKQPVLMLLENVKGLMSHDKGKTLEVILETLQELGYYANIEIRNSKNYNVPQNRERIFFLCKHIKLLSNIGQNEKITTSESIIQEWLFQLLLNNLAEVKKLQEHASKDWVVGYLLLKEINQNLNPSGENILGGISTATGGELFQSTVEPWQNIDIWLSKNLGENFSEVNKSTISIAIKEITESKTFSFQEMLKAILLATVLLRNSSKYLWNEILSSLIIIQENTKYARINNSGEEVIVTESGTPHLASELQEFPRYFFIQHLRGTSRPKVFPIGENSQPDIVLPTLTARYYGGQANGGYIGNKPKQIIGGSQGYRVYKTDGISTTLASQAGGGRSKNRIVRSRRITKTSDNSDR